MGVGEQLDFHSVEPNAFPSAARTLHAAVQIRILLGARKPREQGDADRQRHHERRRRMEVGVCRSMSSKPGTTTSRTLPRQICLWSSFRVRERCRRSKCKSATTNAARSAGRRSTLANISSPFLASSHTCSKASPGGWILSSFVSCNREPQTRQVIRQPWLQLLRTTVARFSRR